MKLTLVYDGSLPAGGNSSRKAAEKWEIRKAFHPQLLEFTQSSRTMKDAMITARIPKEPRFQVFYSHHSDPDEPDDPTEERRDLFAPLIKGAREFIPIVRESLALICGLKILFLRKEEPGSLVLQGGDLDNRLKTLLDALRVPDEAEVRDDPLADSPMYCLLESDTLITALDVKCDRLLSRPNSRVDEVRLIIEVDIRVSLPTVYNLGFLGD